MTDEPSKPPAFFAFWPDRWLGGTSGWSAEEKGCYISLLVHQFVHGSLPDCPRRLSRIAGCAPEAFEAIWADVLSDKFERGSEGLLNARMDEERTRSIRMVKARRANGRKGGRPKKTEQKPSTLALAPPNTKAPQTQTQTQTQHPSSTTLMLESMTSDPRVLRAAKRWQQYRKEASIKAWTATTWRKRLAEAEQDPALFERQVDFSISQGYQGLFTPSQKDTKGPDGITKGLQALKEWHDGA